MNLTERAIFESLLRAPLLVNRLSSSESFDRHSLGAPDGAYRLNFEQKLGHLYEDALGHLIAQSNSLKLISQHIQVPDTSGRTIGEMDFLLRDLQTGKRIHLELAVKFYLATEIDGRWLYPGPDPRDNWNRKLNRLIDHQLKLTERAECKRLLSERFGVNEVWVEHLIYGCVFFHIGATLCVPGAEMFSGCRKGRWVRLRELGEYFAGVKLVRVIPKVLWPVLVSSSIIRGLPQIEVSRLSSLASERCVLCCFEEEPFPIFVVPDSWASLN